MLMHAIQNRAKLQSSEGWLRRWASRIRNIPPILFSDLRADYLRRRGATIDHFTFLSSVHVGGNGKHLSIGNGSFLGKVQIELEDQVTIGANVCINDGVRLLTASHDVRDAGWRVKTGPIVVEDFAWIAMQAIILPGVRIGRGAVIGAGSVVGRDVPAYAVAVGNPCQIREARRAMNLDYSPVRFVGPIRVWLGPQDDGASLSQSETVTNINA